MFFARAGKKGFFLRLGVSATKAETMAVYVVDHSTFTLDIRHEQIFYVNLFIVSVNFLHYFNGPVPVLPRRPFF